jgi:hypothetical protein
MVAALTEGTVATLALGAQVPSTRLAPASCIEFMLPADGRTQLRGVSVLSNSLV